jgi:SAM-dependent methyltransferase
MLAGDTDYESTSHGYEEQRRPDPRIAAMIRKYLGDAQSVLNVGAGAGSYEPRDRYVLAVEPSAAMRARRSATSAVPAISATAEVLPFDDASIDAAMAIFTVHQWADPARGLAELRRVTRGPVVIMTLDVDSLPGFWLGEYLPERLAAERGRFPTVSAIRTAMGGRSEVVPIPIPLDCTDGFLEAFYGRPESLLDPHVRAAQSGWQFISNDIATAGLRRLADDLAAGIWDERHGHLRTQSSYTGPLILITAEP